MCCDSWGRKELDTTEQLNGTLRISMIYLINGIKDKIQHECSNHHSIKLFSSYSPVG